MYNFLKAIAETNQWGFEYSRPDYQNLNDDDIEANKVYLFVDPISIDSKFSETGNESKSYSGRFMLLLSSDVDESYQDKYENYIKPLIDNSLQLLKDDLACSNFQINSFKTLEIINLFDNNFDGVIVNYSISFIE